MTSDSFDARARAESIGSRLAEALGSRRIARALLPVGIHGSLPFAIVGAWAVVIGHVQLRAMTDLGLVSVLPLGTFALLAALTASFCLSLARRPLGSTVPLLHVVALVVMLYGITTFLEPVPRFGSEWKFVGIMNYIGSHRSVYPQFDAFFDWPAFFGLGVLLTKLAGFHSALAIAGWGPLAFNLLFLAPLVVIFRWASDDPRVTWLGLWVFYSTNWVGQDYISNQAMGYTLWLSMLAALLTWFMPRPAKLATPVALRSAARLLDPRRVATRFRSGSESGVTTGTHLQRALLLVLVVAMYGATVMGHQLTPVPVLLTVTALTLLAGLQTRLLPVIMAVLFAGWISYMTTSFLAGQAHQLIGSVGDISQNLSQNVAQRVVGTAEHQFIVKIRVIATVATWLLAAAGVLRRLRAGHADIAMGVVAAVPFLLPALQTYGGEVVFRVILFALPAVSFFIAALAFPSLTTGRNWPTFVSMAVVGCLLIGLFQFTRYGNERVDHFTRGDYATVQAFYRIAPPGSLVYAGNDNLPWRYRDYAAYNYRFVTYFPEWQRPRVDVQALARRMRNVLAALHRGGFIMVTRSTLIYAEVNEGKRRDLEELVAALRVLPGVREVYRNQDGDLFYVPPLRHVPAPNNVVPVAGRRTPEISSGAAPGTTTSGSIQSASGDSSQTGRTTPGAAGRGSLHNTGS